MNLPRRIFGIASISAFILTFLIFVLDYVFNLTVLYYFTFFGFYLFAVGLVFLTLWLFSVKAHIRGVLIAICCIFAFMFPNILISRTDYADYKVTVSDNEKEFTATIRSSPLSTEIDSLIVYEALIPKLLGQCVYVSPVSRTPEPLTDNLAIETEDNRITFIYIGNKLEEGLKYNSETGKYEEFFIWENKSETVTE